MSQILAILINEYIHNWNEVVEYVHSKSGISPNRLISIEKELFGDLYINNKPLSSASIQWIQEKSSRLNEISAELLGWNTLYGGMYAS